MAVDRYLIPIPLAHGRSGNTGLLSVYFSPRLMTDGPVSAYPDWKDWPAAIRGFGGLKGVKVNGVTKSFRVTSVAPSSNKWKAIFAGTTQVSTYFTVDRSGMSMLTFDETALAAAVRGVYGSVAAANPADPPTVTGLLAQSQPSALLTGQNSALPGAQDYMEPMEDPAVAQAPDYDFHQALAMVNAHPLLLRLLGLVVDLEVANLPANPTDVMVATDWPTWGGGGAGIRKEIQIRMKTLSDFRMLPNPSVSQKAQVDGWTDMTKWSLSSVDALAASQQLTPMQGSLGTGTDSGALPAFDDRGLLLMRNQHANALHDEFVRRKDIETAIRNQLNAGGGPVELFAEDVTIGQRIDVMSDVDTTWRSVFKRVTPAYEFPRVPAEKYVPPADEGWTTFLLSSEQAETYALLHHDQESFDVYGPSATQRVRDTVFQWNGWSHVGPQPGRVVDEDGNVIVPPPAAPASTGDPIQLQVTYRVQPKTLPKLRYGRTYRMRARPVDLSGVSRAVTDAQPAAAQSNQAKYGRGLLSAPTIVRELAKSPLPGVGEFVSTIVLLSDYNTPEASIAAQSRVLLPPSTPQTRCELHGLPNGGTDPSVANYNLLSARDAATIADECTTDPVTGDLVVRHPTTGVTRAVLYLPDPATAGAAFNGLPLRATPITVGWVGTWPATMKGIRLIAKATGTGPVVTNAKDGNTITITVPKAFDSTVDVSSTIGATFLDKFGVWQMLSATDQNRLAAMALAGQHWMLSERRGLRIVHAVRRPLLAPRFTALTPTRAPRATDVTFAGTLVVDLASTDRTVLSATWTDPTDSLDSGVVPGTAPGALVLGSVVGTAVSLNPTFPDTKRHDLHVTGEAFSKFSAYFTVERKVTFAPTSVVLDAHGVVGASVVLSNTSTGAVYVLGADYTLDEKTGKVTRLAGAIPASGTVKARYIALPNSRLTTEGGAAQFNVSVPAATAPLPPVVRDVVPAFSFKQKTVGKTMTRTRSGTILRVWTERGWWTSGPGELLGVLIDHRPSAVPATTRYGRDPIVDGPGAGAPARTQFPRAALVRASVSPRTDVAGHTPRYDAVRKLWYSDVEIAGAVGYRPFVRLTLARYQPIAVPGAALSSKIDLDPVRLGPVRTATVTRNAGQPLDIRLIGREHSGIHDETNGGALLHNTVNVSFQRALAGVTDPELKWSTVDGPYAATRTLIAGGLTQWQLVRTPAIAAPLRVLIEESEPSMRSNGSGGVVAASDVVYVETFELN